MNFYSGGLCYCHKVPNEISGAYIFQRPFFRGLFLKGLIFGGAYIGGKFAFQNQLGLYWEGNFCLKIDLSGNFFMSVICRKIFTETHLEDVHLTKTQPCKYFVYMERGNLRQELRVNYVVSKTM